MRARNLVPFAALIALIFVLLWATATTARENTDLADQQHSSDLSKAVPSLLNYQGFLATADSGLVNETLAMTFRLFDSAKEGAELWSETHPAVEVSNGQFYILLGSVTSFPTDLFDGQILYLQLEVGSEVFTPRKAIVSVAYSQMADEADHAATADTSSYAVEAQHATHADTAAFVPGTSLWSVSGDNIYRLTGRVGIGIASPSTELEVIGTVDADAFTINGIAIGSSSDSYWNDTGSHIYYILGNVGVGTATPTARLHVVDSKGHEGSMGSTDYAVHGTHSGGNEGYLGSGDHGAYGKYDGNDNEGVLGGLNAGVEGYAAGTVVGVCGVYGEDQASGNKGSIGCRFEGVYGYNATSGNEGFLGGADIDDYGVGGTAASATGKGVYGSHSSSGNFGWLGGNGEGVYGENGSGNFGNLGGSNEGVYGENSNGHFGRLGAAGKGVEAANSNGNLGDLATNNYGAYGEHNSGNYGLLGGSLIGAYGYNSNGNFGSLGENNHAVYGYYNSGNFGYIGNSDYGVYGRNSAGHFGYFGNNAYGVYGRNSAGHFGYFGGGVGAHGQNSNGNYGNLGDGSNGVYGRHNNGNQGFVGSNNYGIMGSNSSGYFGYLGKNDQGAGGQSSTGNMGHLGTSNYGVFGQHTSNNVGYIGSSSRAVEGHHSGGNFGFLGASGSGALGQHTNGNNGLLGSDSYGVYGYSQTAAAVKGNHSSGNEGYIGNVNHGVYGVNANGNNGILGGSDAAVKGNASSGYAGYFSGNVHVSGSVNKAACSFLIDHPLDPENKWLRHTCMESPEPLVVYRGRARLDGSGQSVVEMPEYFVVLTKEDQASIHLTPVGRPFMTGAEWNSGFSSLIVYGEAGREVFWEVLAERDDPVIHQLAQPVEEDKVPEERGYYLHPKAFGLSEGRNIEWVRNPDMMRARNASAETRQAALKSKALPVEVLKWSPEPDSPQQGEEKSTDHPEPQGKRNRQ